jgi:translation initiation factor 1 (eIF-1/SUI1)
MDEDIDFDFIIHIHVMKSKGRKFYTEVIGIPEEFDFPKILKYWKKNYNCTGAIVEGEKS